MDGGRIRWGEVTVEPAHKDARPARIGDERSLYKAALHRIPKRYQAILSN